MTTLSKAGRYPQPFNSVNEGSLSGNGTGRSNGGYVGASSPSLPYSIGLERLLAMGWRSPSRFLAVEMRVRGSSKADVEREVQDG